jgi:pilus assembly protein CpaF
MDCMDIASLGNLAPAAAPASPAGSLRRSISPVSASICARAAAGIAAAICDDLFGLGPLEPLMALDGVTDIMVNGLQGCFVELRGAVIRAPVALENREQLMAICQRAAARAGRRVDEASPICDARLPGGGRLNVIWPPLAADGPVLTIRRFRGDALDLDGLERLSAFGPKTRRLLEALVAARCNLLAIGGAGSGKTTLVNALIGAIPENERVVICEDAAELRVEGRHAVRLETRAANFEGAGEVTMRALLRNALRMRPDRVVVGEVRGAEALDLAQAMNCGHDGSMGTLHANDPQQALIRLETLAMMGGHGLSSAAVRGLLAGGLDIILHLARCADGARRLMRVSEMAGGGGEPALIDLMARSASKPGGEETLARRPGERLARKAEAYGAGDALAAAFPESAPSAAPDPRGPGHG